MARSKDYNPLLKSYPDSEKVNAVTIGAETLYTRLIAQSDDNGNYWGNPLMIVGKLYTHRLEALEVNEMMVSGWLDELEKVGLITRYSVSGRVYLHMIDAFKTLRKDIKPKVLYPPIDNASVTDSGRVRNESVPTEPHQNHTRTTPTPSAKRGRSPASVPAPEAEEPQAHDAREPDPIWDTIVAVFFPGGVSSRGQKTRVGKIVRDLKDEGATPAQIKQRVKNLRQAWDGRNFSPEALLKHWSTQDAIGEAGNEYPPGFVPRNPTPEEIAREAQYEK